MTDLIEDLVGPSLTNRSRPSRSPRGHRGKVFALTHPGYLLADELIAAGTSG